MNSSKSFFTDSSRSFATVWYSWYPLKDFLNSFSRDYLRIFFIYFCRSLLMDSARNSFRSSFKDSSRSFCRDFSSSFSKWFTEKSSGYFFGNFSEVPWRISWWNLWKNHEGLSNENTCILRKKIWQNSWMNFRKIPWRNIWNNPLRNEWKNPYTNHGRTLKWIDVGTPTGILGKIHERILEKDSEENF